MCQSCGQSAGGITLVVVPPDLLPEKSLEEAGTQSGGEILAGNSEANGLKRNNGNGSIGEDRNKHSPSEILKNQKQLQQISVALAWISEGAGDSDGRESVSRKFQGESVFTQ